MRALLLPALLALLASTASAGDRARDVASPQPGFKTVDVDSLPPEQQARWPLVVQKCSRCHSMDVSLSHAYTLAEWKASMRRMVRIPGAGISAPQAAEILEFLRWYSSGASRR